LPAASWPISCGSSTAAKGSTAFSTLSKLGCRLTLFHVISPDVGAAQSVARRLSLIGDRADHVAVINLKHGTPPSAFSFWIGFTDAKGVAKGGKTREKLLALGGVEIEFPALPAGGLIAFPSINFGDPARLLQVWRGHADTVCEGIVDGRPSAPVRRARRTLSDYPLAPFRLAHQDACNLGSRLTKIPSPFRFQRLQRLCVDLKDSCPDSAPQSLRNRPSLALDIISCIL
jgi:hypothetical protein